MPLFMRRAITRNMLYKVKQRISARRSQICMDWLNELVCDFCDNGASVRKTRCKENTLYATLQYRFIPKLCVVHLWFSQKPLRIISTRFESSQFFEAKWMTPTQHKKSNPNRLEYPDVLLSFHICHQNNSTWTEATNNFHSLETHPNWDGICRIRFSPTFMPDDTNN